MQTDDPVKAFIEAACVPRDGSGHRGGTLDEAETILSQYPQVGAANIYTAAILADEPVVRRYLAEDPNLAIAKGGSFDWDALTYLCFSRYLRIDRERSQSFVNTARALLEAGASANTGWYETIDHPNPRQILESALYGAAGVSMHAGVTRLLLEYGGDPNDEETPYHVPETYDNTVLQVLLDSGRLDGRSLAWLLLRKTDWHDTAGIRLLLENGADPNNATRFGGRNSLQHAIQRDNRVANIELLLDFGANPTLTNSAAMAARRGRGDVLQLFAQRGFPADLKGVDLLIAACARADREAIDSLISSEPHLADKLIAQGGSRLAEFSGNGNLQGVQCLLDLGVNVAALYEGDGYFDIAKNSTALHAAAWRAWPAIVKELLERGAPVNALDGKGRTALNLAVKACVDSFWTDRRSPESVRALLNAGAAVNGVKFPSGYAEVDALLQPLCR